MQKKKKFFAFCGERKKTKNALQKCVLTIMTESIFQNSHILQKNKKRRKSGFGCLKLAFLYSIMIIIEITVAFDRRFLL